MLDHLKPQLICASRHGVLISGSVISRRNLLTVLWGTTMATRTTEGQSGLDHRGMPRGRGGGGGKKRGGEVEWRRW